MEIAQPPVRVDQAVVCWQLSFHLKIIRKIAERNDLIKLDTFIYNYERQRTLTKHLQYARSLTIFNKKIVLYMNTLVVK